MSSIDVFPSVITIICWFQGQLSVQNAYLETGLLPPFPFGFFQFRFTFSDSNSTNTEIVGNIKFYFQVMEPIKSKKRKHRKKWMKNETKKKYRHIVFKISDYFFEFSIKVTSLNLPVF